MTGPTVFGTTETGETVHRAVLSAGDLAVALLEHGAVVQDVRLAGVAHSLTLGSPDLAAYEGRMASCGAIMGPVANRISGARARIGDATHAFHSDTPTLLHGGTAATHRRVWRFTDIAADRAALTLSLPDGEGGFPGNRTIRAEFRLLPPATLRLTLTATTDAPTLINLANHSYWRLADTATVAGHVLRIAADRYLPATEAVLPTGEVAPVQDTRFDYREGRALQSGAEGLIDTNFCLSDARTDLRPVAWLTGPTGLTLELATTEPGLQVFDGHSLDLPQYRTCDGGTPAPYCAVALEAQFWPDAPTHPHFPSILLRPGAPWEQVTEWRFSRP